MSLGSAMLTGFTGIQSNQLAVETIGNNVANVNTTAYKTSRALFETLLFRTTTEGSPPGELGAGTNPIQFGYGSGLATTQRLFEQGGTERTGVVSDLAVDGDGFFVLESPAGDRAYTRDGAFSLNAENTLVSANGSFVQGYAAAEDGTIADGSLANLVIPLGQRNSAAATTEAILTGNLHALSEVATAGSVSTSDPLVTDSGDAAGVTTALSSLVDGAGVSLFNSGDVVTVQGAQKGGIDVPAAQFVVGTDGTTLGDLAAFLETALAIDTSDSAIGSPGVVVGDGVAGSAGALVIASNAGDVNAISIDSASIRNSTTGVAPLRFTTSPATGEGATTSFLAFDSLGTPVEVRLRMVPESRTESGSTWRFTAESVNDGDAGALVGGGTITFDQNGRFVSADGTEVSIPRSDTGAATPLNLNLDFSGMTGLTASEGVSTVALSEQDGYPEGTLVGYGVGPDGVIEGTFSNGQQTTLGQVVLATFVNNQGLVGQSENTFMVGRNSGEAVIVAPQTGMAGRINSAELELSNVDLGRELIGLITASTGFSAASRAVRTADQMLQEAMLLVR